MKEVRGTMREKLERLVELAKAATPAPWDFYCGHSDNFSAYGAVVSSEDHPDHPGQSVCDVFEYNHKADAEFIALARTVAPWAARALIDRETMVNQGVAGAVRLYGYFTREELEALLSRMKATQVMSEDPADEEALRDFDQER